MDVQCRLLKMCKNALEDSIIVARVVGRGLRRGAKSDDARRVRWWSDEITDRKRSLERKARRPSVIDEALFTSTISEGSSEVTRAQRLRLALHRHVL